MNKKLTMNKRVNKAMNRKRLVINKKNTRDIKPCPHLAFCSGCESSASLKNPPLLEEAINYFTKKSVLNLKVLRGNPFNWRTRVKLVVRGTSNSPVIGLYQKGTHVAINIPFCKVHHPKINEAVELIKEKIKQEKIEPYDEATGKGELRYIQLGLERSSEKVQVTFVLNKTSEENFNKWLLAPANLWHSIWLNFNKKKTNTIFGETWAHIEGPPLILEKLSGVSCFFHPAGFMQANLTLFEALLKSIEEKMLIDSRVVEYYAGVGVIGFKILPKVQSVICCEITKEAKECFEKSQDLLPQKDKQKISFETGFSEKRLDLLENVDVVIVDPPRKGVDLKLLSAISKKECLKEIFYVSCGFLSFCRDCDYLLANGWFLKSVETYLFFPGSNHLETFAVFAKLPTQET